MSTPAVNPLSITDHYDVLFKSKLIDNPEDAQLFLLADEHNNQDCRKLNGKFIEQRSLPAALLVVEGSSALGPLKNEEITNKCLAHLGIDSSISTRFTTLGWDLPDIGDLLKKVKKYDNLLDRDIANLNRLGRAKLGLLESKEPQNELKKVCDELSLAEESYNKHDLERYELLASTFPARTLSMVDTLSKIEKWIDEINFEGKVFLDAGAFHLQPSDTTKDDERFSLAMLYEKVALFKAAVLVPKLIKV